MRWARFMLMGLAAAMLWFAGCHRAEPPPPAAEAQVQQVANRPPPAPRPEHWLAPGASCVNDACHTNFGDARQVHQPIAEGSCESCHAPESPETGIHRFPLLRQGNETCTFCHTVSGTLAHQHAAVQADGCMACHDPHASSQKYLIKALSVERLCAQCHDLPMQQFVHGPFERGQCMLCHEPHQSAAKGLVRGPGGREHCLSCHLVTEVELLNASHVHEPARHDCLNCHHPHSSPYLAQTAAAPRDLCVSCHDSFASRLDSAAFVHGATNTGAACNHCHNPHGGSSRVMLRSREDRLCLNCHNQPIRAEDGRTVAALDAMLSRTFLHGPIRTGECSPCHNPHGAEHNALLHQPFPASFYAPFDMDNYALCFQCHSSELATTRHTAALTEFRDGQVNLHYVHVNQPGKGRTCRTCHAIHGSDLPNHMAASVPFEGSRWAMPIGYERGDDGGRCAPGCHEPKTYQRGSARVSAAGT
jgi:predicted CXXCH cytochrome family protein